MKILAINGSPRKNGNTNYLLNEVLTVLKEHDIDTELVHIGGKKINGCVACMKCKDKKDGFCQQKNDLTNDLIQKMIDADGILIGSPVYFADITSEVKAFMDVAGYALRATGKNPLQHKVGASVIAVRRAGAIHAFDTLNHFFLINEMIIPGSSYWNIGIGREEGDVLKDKEGIKTMHTLGKNMAWLLKKINN